MSGFVRTIITVLIALVILAAAWWLFSLAQSYLGLPAIFGQILVVVIVVVAIVFGLKWLRDQA